MVDSATGESVHYPPFCQVAMPGEFLFSLQRYANLETLFDRRWRCVERCCREVCFMPHQEEIRVVSCCGPAFALVKPFGGEVGAEKYVLELDRGVDLRLIIYHLLNHVIPAQAGTPFLRVALARMRPRAEREN